MDASQESTYNRLMLNLEDLTKNYRSLLEVLRKEKEFLVKADVENLSENNKAKETLLYKIRSQDAARERYAKEATHVFGGDVEQPRLLDLARRIGGAEGEKLRGLHSALDLLMQRLISLNKENEEYAQSALNVVNGALGNIKDTLAPKKTYERKGQMATGVEKSGNFVSKNF